MSNGYAGPSSWQSQAHPSYSHHSQLQLEHELDYSGDSAAADNQGQASQSTGMYGASYQYSQQQHHHHQQQSVPAFSPPLNNFNQNAPQPPQQRVPSFGSSNFGVPTFYGSISNEQAQNAGASFNPPRPYHSNNPSYEYDSQSRPGSLAPSALHPVDAAPAAYLATSPLPMQETFPTSPPPSGLAMHGQQSTYYPPHDPGQGISKRPRSDHTEDARGDDHDDDSGNNDSKESKAKPPGACARCKGLKVRCEFRTDTDPCKRCLNGGHDCVVPGRKKRRTPPKREHLLNQIRDQADEIHKLMAQLEAMSSQGTTAQQNQPSPASIGASTYPSGSTVPSTTGADLHSPVLSPTSAQSSYFSDINGKTHEGTPETTKAVADWIAKARDTLLQFDGFLGAVPKRLVVEEDYEDTGSDSDDYEYVDAEEGDEEMPEAYVISVQNDGEAQPPADGRKIRHQLSGTSLNGKRKESEDLVSRPPAQSPFGIFATMLKKALPETETNEGSKPEVGVANPDFFKRLSSQQQFPHILTRGIITLPEAEQLFKIYYDRMNLSVSLLDPVLYTAATTCARSPFLFTVICAIASRFYTERPGLYSDIMHYAQLAAGTALISGPKNIEAVQAYILLSLYPVPARRWEEDRGWLYLGLAIRFAVDLNLHHPSSAKPQNEAHAREMLNRTRVWLNCFNLDRSTGSQYGKAAIIPNTDYVANHSEDWWRSSPYNMDKFDIHICGYNAELRVMAAFTAKIYSDPNHPTGLNKDVDFERHATATDEELQRLGSKWFNVLDQMDMSDEQFCFRTGLLKLAYSYARMVALSYAFQHAFGKAGMDENPFLTRCLTAATDVVTTVVDNIGRPNQRKFLRHGPEAQSVFVTFAAAFLVKLLQPKFATYLSLQQRLDIRRHVMNVIELFGGPEVALDDRHGPKLYARFLKNLLNSPMAKVDTSGTSPMPRQKSSHRSKSASMTPEPDRALDLQSSTLTSYPSPSTGSYTLSPPPTQLAMSFDRFAPQGGAIDPFIGNFPAGQSNISAQDAVGVTMNIQEYLQPVLPYDNDIVQGIQALTDPSVWQSIADPGYSWLTQFSQATTMHMNGAQTSNPTMYENHSQRRQ